MSVLDLETSDACVDKPGLLQKRLEDIWYTLCLKLDPKNSPRKRCRGCNRGSFLVLCGVCLLVLIITLSLGLGIGLRRLSGSHNLPLPKNSEIYQGDLTYYAPGLGACGKTSTDGDDICAVSHIIFDAVSRGSNPNTNPLCGLKIRVTRYDEHVNAQRSLDLTVVDRCTGCAPTDLDLSPVAFKKLADSASGRVHVSWAWLSPTPSIH